MERIKLYLRESFSELKENVSWPTWENLQQTTMVVLGSTVVVSFLIFLMDLISNQITKLIYNL